MKASGDKFVMITAYDATFARLASEAGAETILVGDSLGMVLQGHETTIPVSLDAMTYHTECVARARPHSLIVADLPFMSFSNADDTLHASTRLMQAGAQMVKLEGGTWLSDSIHRLVERGVPVCAHLGLTPQSVNVFGGTVCRANTKGSEIHFSRRGRDSGRRGQPARTRGSSCRARRRHLIETRYPGHRYWRRRGTDAQVLVLHDMLGMTETAPKFVQNFMEGAPSIQDALKAFVDAVKAGEYPREEHTYS